MNKKFITVLTENCFSVNNVAYTTNYADAFMGVSLMHIFEHDGSFGHMLGRTSRAMLNMLQKKFRQAGCEITVEQWTLLINIRNAGGQSQQQLAELAYLDKTTIARLAAGLEKKALSAVSQPATTGGKSCWPSRRRARLCWRL